MFDPLDNPLNLAYTSCWSQVDASAAVTKLVRPGNKIKLMGVSDVNSGKDEISQADLPELVLVGTTLKGGLRTTSNGSECTLGLQWVIATGDPSINRLLFPVMFAVYSALVGWPGIATGIPWRNGTPIKRVDLLESNLGLVNQDQNRGIMGWSAVWSAEIFMQFLTSDVIDYSNATPFGE